LKHNVKGQDGFPNTEPDHKIFRVAKKNELEGLGGWYSTKWGRRPPSVG
jgi:hypothetical protein